MKLCDLAEKLNWTLLAGAEGINREVTGGYAGDLLSWVMGRAKGDQLWFTVMGNINAIAVATLTDVSGILLTEGASLDEDARQRADQQGVAVYSTSLDTHSAILRVEQLNHAAV